MPQILGEDGVWMRTTFFLFKSLNDIVTSLSEFRKTFETDKMPPSVDEFIDLKRLEMLSVLNLAHEAQDAISKRESELKEKIAKLEDWSKTETRYELWEIMPARFAHRLKLEFTNADETFHYVCSN